MTSKNFYDHPLYVRAKEMWENIRLRQIQKGAEKYPEPLNPASWSVVDLIEHGIMENVDQLHYYIALLEKVEMIQAELATEKRKREDAENRAQRAEKQLADILVTAERERRKWAYYGR
jgi:hypothetical protein